MRLRSILLVLLLLAPAGASAGPITSGVWTPVTDIGDPFWDNVSWDCPTCGVLFKLADYTGLNGLEALHDGSGNAVQFQFDDTSIDATLIFHDTSWLNGVLGRDGTGAFTYDSNTGRLSNSWTLPQQYALFRKVGPTTTQYFLGIEDILLSEALNDRDYNDYGIAFTLPTSVPEPSTMLLTGLGLVGIASRRRQLRKS